MVEKLKIKKLKKRSREPLPLSPQYHKYFFKNTVKDGPVLYHARYDVVKTVASGDYVNVDGKVMFIRNTGKIGRRVFPTEREARWVINKIAAQKYNRTVAILQAYETFLKTLLAAGLYVDVKDTTYDAYVDGK